MSLNNRFAKPRRMLVGREVDDTDRGQQRRIFIVRPVDIFNLAHGDIWIDPLRIIWRRIRCPPVQRSSYISIYSDVQIMRRMLRIENDGHVERDELKLGRVGSDDISRQAIVKLQESTVGRTDYRQYQQHQQHGHIVLQSEAMSSSSGSARLTYPSTADRGPLSFGSHGRDGGITAYRVEKQAHPEAKRRSRDHVGEVRPRRRINPQ